MVVPYHKHPEGYFWLRLPGGGDNRVLWHRQLYQDLQGRPLAENMEVHHVDHDRANNCAAKLVARRGRDHRRHHARARRGPAGWRRIRCPTTKPSETSEKGLGGGDPGPWSSWRCQSTLLSPPPGSLSQQYPSGCLW